MADKRDYALPFAAWEVRLYLDTHPEDRQALALYQTLCQQCGQADNYACIDSAMNQACRECPSTPLTAPACPLRWTWVDEPWPWEHCHCLLNMDKEA
ncbi:MAG: spore coat protein CotJB [Clostridia bacterium]|nr:spore coat protein CotJB [Clostridia bacterium]